MLEHKKKLAVRKPITVKASLYPFFNANIRNFTELHKIDTRNRLKTIGFLLKNRFYHLRSVESISRQEYHPFHSYIIATFRNLPKTTMKFDTKA